MEWRLLAVPGSFWVLLFLSGCPAPPLRPARQTPSRAGTAVSTGPSRPSSLGGGRRAARRAPPAVPASPRGIAEGTPRPAGASRPGTRETTNGSDGCGCDVAVGSNETKEVLATKESSDSRYLLPQDLRGISVDLELSHGTYTVSVSNDSLCVTNSSMWYKILFRALPHYPGINKWAIRISVNNCTETFRSPYLYSLNHFVNLRVVANGYSCWRTSPSDCEESSPEESKKDPTPQKNAPSTFDHKTILPIIALVIITMIVVVAFLLIRRKVKSNSRAEHPTRDPVHQRMSLQEALERRGSLHDSQNSLYEAWTPGDRGSAHDSVNSMYIAYTETGTGLMGSRPAPVSCDGK